jgi:hypothetical protein
MEWTIVEFAEALVFIGMLRWNFVGKPEEEEMEGLSWNKVEARCFDLPCMWLGLNGTLKGVWGCLHLFEPVYD